MRAPLRGLASSVAISTIVRRALERAGIESPCKGAHLLRHSLASQMLAHHASLAEIGEILRHRSPQHHANLHEGRSRCAARLGLGMARRCAMTSLIKADDDYLRLRRALGFKLRDTEVALHDSSRSSGGRGPRGSPPSWHSSWATEPQHAQPAHRARRLGMVRLFAEYRSACDASHRVPPLGLLPDRYRRKEPYLYSDAEVHRLLEPRERSPPLRACAADVSDAVRTAGRHGMRISEVVALDVADVDLHGALLTIRARSSASPALSPYTPPPNARSRATRAGAIDSSPGHSRRASFGRSAVRGSPTGLCGRRSSSSRTRSVCEARRSLGPRLHDFRHRFAVRTLLGWYRRGVDIDPRMPGLSAYLGHAHVTDTYWYLSAVPELLSAAARRLERSSRRERR